MNTTSAFAGQVNQMDSTTLFNLNGNIKKLINETVEFSASTLIKGLINKIRRPKDKLQLISRTIDNIDFYPNGLRIGQVLTKPGGGYRYEYRYDDQNKRTGPYYYDSPLAENYAYRVEFEYDETGLKRKLQRQIDFNNNLMLTVYFYYDSLNRRKQLCWVNPKGALIRSYYYNYNTQNLRTKLVILENNKHRVNQHYYNRNGNMKCELSSTSISLTFYLGSDEGKNFVKCISIKLSVHPNWYYLPDIQISMLRRSVTYF